METLKRSIRGHKARITVLRNKLADVHDRKNISELRNLRDSLATAIQKVESLNDQVNLLISDDETLIEEMTEAEEYSYLTRVEIHKLNEAITLALPQTPILPAPRPVGIKLPKLNIKKFDGDFTEWSSFWDIFEASVHKRTDLEGIEKFTYLKGLIEGEALKLVQGFNLEAQYYDEAVKLLQDTYGREAEIKMSFVRNLLQLESPNASPEALQEFRANFECQIRSLNALNLTLEEMYTILLYCKLPTSISEIIKRKADENWLKFDTFKSQLESEINNLRTFRDDKFSGLSMSTVSTNNPSVSTLSTLVVQNKKSRSYPTCALCNKSHNWTQCRNYESRDSKFTKLKQLGLCFVCAQRGHSSTKCTKKTCGNGCTYNHHICLCNNTKREGRSKATQESYKGAEKVEVNTLAVGSQNSQTTETRYKSVLPTATVMLKGTKRDRVTARSLLDPCSEKTFVCKSLLGKVKYRPKGTIKLRLNGYCSSIPEKTYDMVTLSIPYRDNLISLDAIVVDELPEYSKRFSIDERLSELKRQKIKLADKEFNLPLDKQSPIELLIGVDNVYNVLHPGFKKIGKLVLLPSIFGYVLTGSYKEKTAVNEVNVVSVLKLATTPVEEYLEHPSVISNSKTSPNEMESLWTMDHLGICDTEINNQDREVLKNFENTVVYSEDENQYIVSLPWKINHPPLPSNFGLALNRLKSLSRKFENDKNFMTHYSNVLKEQEARGFIERVSDKYQSNSHYLAHHGVKRDSRTTPVRIVFDCSAKRDTKSPSLNDCLWTGPTLTSDLLQILLRFRLNEFACASDIEKAFLMVQLRGEDRNFTRFLWLEDPKNPNSKLITYRFRVVLFGAKSSPFLLNATIRKHLSLSKDQYHMKNWLYVDNLLYTDQTEENLVKFFHDSCKIFAEANLHLKEWVSNSTDLQTLATSYGVDGEVKETNKILGLGWKIKEDSLRLMGHISSPGKLTKREILRNISQVFDPCGYMLPVTIRSRIFLQEIWRIKVSWDEQLPVEFTQLWKDLYKDLKECYDISFPRQLSFTPNDLSLHLFSDASNKAYGCVAYAVSNGCSSLIAAKARVAPLRNLSVPKLELTAALLSARLADFIVKTYDSLLFEQIYVWIDSKVTISWLTSNKPLQVYVRNRVDEIRSLLPNAKFIYVNTKENPSDLASRGITANSLKTSFLWWEGPSWLKEKALWPLEEDLGSPEVEQDESNVFGVTQDVSILHVKEDVDGLMDWKRFSSFKRFIRTMAWMLRFMRNTRKRAQQRRLGNLSPATMEKAREAAHKRELEVLTLKEVEEAKSHVLRLIQRSEYNEEYNSLERGDKRKLHLINQLNLYMDKGLIKCKGRLEKADLPEEARFPLLMPKGHPVTLIIMREAHETVAHMGMNATVAEVRRQYWIPQIRQGIRKLLRTCVTCKKVQGKSYRASVIPPLPEFRVKCKEPFSTTGIDYTGALTVRTENRQTEKAYIILFTCPVSRAIHMELVNNLSCHSFLLAFRKFCNRRSFPSLVLSDNATTFVAAAGFLRDIAESREVQEHLIDIKCSWQFIPARAPWFGAIWERLIGLVKACLKKVLGQALVTFEELCCILVELEAIINDRPLGYDPGDLNQLEVLTPNHLLYGRKLRIFPKEVISWEEFSSDPTVGIGDDVTRRFKYISHLCDHLWKRWKREYLSALRETHNNNVRSNTWPGVGDLVLIHDEGPRAKWKMGRIIGLYPGGDGIVRVVQLKTSVGLLNRPTVKLYPLELSSTVEPEDSPEDAAPSQRPTRRTALVAAQTRKRLVETGQL